MKGSWKKLLLRWDLLTLLALALYPIGCALLRAIFPSWANEGFGDTLGDQLSTLLAFAILALALNVAVGYTGLLQLGIAAFFGIGVYITGILTVPSNPFQFGFTAALILSTVGAAFCGLILGAPTLRLRGDYLALVTLGFGEVVKVTLRNLEQITAGTKGFESDSAAANPWLFAIRGNLARAGWERLSIAVLRFAGAFGDRGTGAAKSGAFKARSCLDRDSRGRACGDMYGSKRSAAKLASFATSAGLAGLAGCLYATKLTTTADPNAYDFNRSIIMLCCVILGGLGSIRGTILGVFLLLGFDNIISPQLDSWIQNSEINQTVPHWIRSITSEDSTLPQMFERLLTFGNWKLMIFGLALVLMMRLRPEGLLPSLRMQHELHSK